MQQRKWLTHIVARNYSLMALPTFNWNHFGRPTAMPWSGRKSFQHGTTIRQLQVTRVKMRIKLKNLVTNKGLRSTRLGCHSSCIKCHSNCIGYHSNCFGYHSNRFGYQCISQKTALWAQNSSGNPVLKLSYQSYIHLWQGNTALWNIMQ